MFLALPIAIVASVFGVIREAVGTLVYVSLLALGSAWFAATFSAYLKS
jgi:hypothetical protein